jgi:hypothetical protein
LFNPTLKKILIISSAQLHLTIVVSWNKLIETFWTCRDGFRIYEMIPETISEAQEISLQSNTLKDMIFKNVTKKHLLDYTDVICKPKLE